MVSPDLVKMAQHCLLASRPLGVMIVGISSIEEDGQVNFVPLSQSPKKLFNL